MSQVFSYVAIPALDFERAFDFYDEITGGLLQRNPNVPFPMAYFVDREGRSVGHLFQLPTFSPSASGIIVYFELANNLNETIDRIVRAGGRVTMPKTPLGPGKGHWALFLDTEGNRLALHSVE